MSKRSRTAAMESLPIKVPRSHEENQERAYIAASRRTDRSLEARLQSARMASALHKKRTGKGFKLSEEIVLKEEMYEEEDDVDLESRLRQLARLQNLQTASPSLNNRLTAYVTTNMAIHGHGMPSDRWDEINRRFAQAYPHFRSNIASPQASSPQEPPRESRRDRAHSIPLGLGTTAGHPGRSRNRTAKLRPGHRHSVDDSAAAATAAAVLPKGSAAPTSAYAVNAVWGPARFTPSPTSMSPTASPSLNYVQPLPYHFSTGAPTAPSMTSSFAPELSREVKQMVSFDTHSLTERQPESTGAWDLYSPTDTTNLTPVDGGYGGSVFSLPLRSANTDQSYNLDISTLSGDVNNPGHGTEGDTSEDFTGAGQWADFLNLDGGFGETV